MHVRLAATVSALSILAGMACRTPLDRHAYTPIPPRPVDTIHFPELNVEREATAGATMISSSTTQPWPGIKLADAITVEDRQFVNWFRLTIPAGTLFAAAEDHGGTFYQSIAPVSFAQDAPESPESAIGQRLGPSRAARGGIYVPRASDSSTELYWLTHDAKPQSVPYPRVPFQRVTLTLASKRELVYSGASGTTITATYREFTNDLKTPTLSEDLKFDLSKGTELECRGARFQVVAATEALIQYRVLAYLR